MSQPLALVIDDEPDICELLKLTLGRMDIRTETAMDVAGAKVADQRGRHGAPYTRIDHAGAGAEQQAATGQVPDDRTVLVERFRDELGLTDEARCSLKQGVLVSLGLLVLASLLSEGSVSYLYYADRLVQFPLGIFAQAAATAADTSA